MRYQAALRPDWAETYGNRGFDASGFSRFFGTKVEYVRVGRGPHPVNAAELGTPNGANCRPPVLGLAYDRPVRL